MVNWDFTEYSFTNLSLHDHCRRGEKKDCKSQKIRRFTLRLYLIAMLEATPIKSHDHDFSNKLNKDDTNVYTKVYAEERNH